MQPLNDTAFSQDTPEHCPTTLAVRTYRRMRIAEIFVDHAATRISPARVAQICRVAEMKLAHMLQADLMMRERLCHNATHGDQATQSGKRSVYELNHAALFRKCPEPLNLHVWSQS